MSRSTNALVLVASALLASGCGAASSPEQRSTAAGPVLSPKPENAMRANDAPPNKRFANLDAYLDWLRLTQAPVDGSWYEEVSPGVYRLHTGNLRVLTAEGEATPAPQTFTREQLARQFGFSR